MPLSDDQRTWVRSHVGDAPPSDVELDAIFDRLASLAGTVEEVLRKRLAELLRQPASVSFPGKLSVNRAANIAALQKQLTAFIELAGSVVTLPRVLPVPLPSQAKNECVPWGQPAIMRGRPMP